MRRSGFSLVELTMVLLILGLVSAAVALNVRAPAAQVGMKACVDDVVAFDRLTRTMACELDRPLRLVVDLGAGQLRRTDERGGAEEGRILTIPSGYRLTDLRLAGRSVPGGAALNCSARGLMPTYAVLVEGPGGVKQWVLLAGLTGQEWKPKDEREVQDILRTIEAWPDAG